MKCNQLGPWRVGQQIRLQRPVAGKHKPFTNIPLEVVDDVITEIDDKKAIVYLDYREAGIISLQNDPGKFNICGEEVMTRRTIKKHIWKK